MSPSPGLLQCTPWISDQVETQELDRLPVQLHRTKEWSNSQKPGRARLEPIVVNVQFELPTRQEGAQPYQAGRKGTLEALPNETEAEQAGQLGGSGEQRGDHTHRELEGPSTSEARSWRMRRKESMEAGLTAGHTWVCFIKWQDLTVSSVVGRATDPDPSEHET